MPFLNEHLKHIQPYKLVSQKAWHDPSTSLKLDWNESTIPPSPLVLERTLAAFESNYLHWYPDIANTKLIKKLAEYCGTEPENILYFASSDSAHEAVCRTYLGAGDRVLAIAPTYDHFRLTVETVGATFTPYRPNNPTFRADLKDLEVQIGTTKPKLAYICNPNNPTGTFIEADHLVAMASRHQSTLFLIDEAYIEFHPDSVSAAVNSLPNLLVSRTMSKAFGLAGFRFGYLVVHESRATEIGIVRNPKNVSTFAQIAAEAALDDVDYMRRYVANVSETREWMRSEIEKRFGTAITSYPSNANFLLLRFTTQVDASAFCETMAAKNMFVRGLAHLQGLDRHVRLTIGLRAQMEQLLAAMESSLR